MVLLCDFHFVEEVAALFGALLRPDARLERALPRVLGLRELPHATAAGSRRRGAVNEGDIGHATARSGAPNVWLRQGVQVLLRPGRGAVGISGGRAAVDRQRSPGVRLPGLSLPVRCLRAARDARSRDVDVAAASGRSPHSRCTRPSARRPCGMRSMRPASSSAPPPRSFAQKGTGWSRPAAGSELEARRRWQATEVGASETAAPAAARRVARPRAPADEMTVGPEGPGPRPSSTRRRTLARPLL